MPIHKKDIADIFEHVADLLEIKGDNPFRIRSYRNAARTAGSLSKNVSDLVWKGEDLTKYPGIGKDLAGKIEQVVQTGKLEHYTRQQASRQAEELGARVTSSVSANTDYVVAGENPGGKLEEARKRNVEIIDEQKYEELIRNAK